MLDLVGSVLVIDAAGLLVEPGDKVWSPDLGGGVFQRVHESGLVTVAGGPGRVYTVEPHRYGLRVSGVATCGCAMTIGDSFRGMRRHRVCTGHPHTVDVEWVPADGIPQLDDLL